MSQVAISLREEVVWKVDLEPLVLPDVVNSGPLHWISLQHVAEQRHHLLIKIVWYRKHSG